MALDPKLRHPREPTLFAIGVVLSSLVWLALLFSIVGALYALVLLGVVLLAHGLQLAWVRGNGVRLSDQQLPELYERCHQAAQKLGLEQFPEIYLVQSGGVLNAFATRLLSRQFVVLTSS